MNPIVIRIVLTCVCLISCSLQLNAQNYITIHFNNGQAAESFYEMDIDSIVCSKIGIDNNYYSDWKTQEIWTRDSVYRYSLDIIDNVETTPVNIEDMFGEMAQAINDINPIFLNYESVAEFMNHINDIRSKDYVQDVWNDDITVYIKIKCGRTLSFTYPPLPSDDDDYNVQVTNTMSKVKSRATVTEHPHKKSKKVYIVNQTCHDDRFSKKKIKLESIKRDFNDCGFDAEIIESPSLYFFQAKDNQGKGVSDCDILFLITHGGYDPQKNLHWIFTGQELYVLNEGQKVDTQTFMNRYYFYIGKNISPNHVNVSSIKEVRGGKSVSVLYLEFSELFINNEMSQLSHNPIIFNVACKSLMKNSNVAKCFHKKGAMCYIGYTHSNTIGCEAGNSFFRNLLNGKSLKTAYYNLDDKYLHNDTAFLIIEPYPNNPYCITWPETKESDDLSTDNSLKIKLKGQMTLYDPLTAANRYGFRISKDRNMNTYTILDPIYDGCSISSNILQFEQTINNNTVIQGEKLDYNTNYYYCSYIYDGDNYCFGNIESFKTKEKVANDNICPDENHPHMIDLGLPSGTKWCCCNEEANSPEEYGGYYAWGETDGNKKEYSFKTYIHKTKGDPNDYIDDPNSWYYCDGGAWFWSYLDNVYYAYDNIGVDISNTKYDVAYTLSAGSRRMPGASDFEELLSNSISKHTNINGISGYLYTGPNGNKIFMPEVGEKETDELFGDLSDNYTFNYWTSNLDDYMKGWAQNYIGWLINSNKRYIGLPVRGVSK